MTSMGDNERQHNFMKGNKRPLTANKETEGKTVEFHL
jgi:hypothetical protein